MCETIHFPDKVLLSVKQFKGQEIVSVAATPACPKAFDTAGPLRDRIQPGLDPPEASPGQVRDPLSARAVLACAVLRRGPPGRGPGTHGTGAASRVGGKAKIFLFNKA